MNSMRRRHFRRRLVKKCGSIDSPAKANRISVVGRDSGRMISARRPRQALPQTARGGVATVRATVS